MGAALGLSLLQYKEGMADPAVVQEWAVKTIEFEVW